MNKKQTIQLAIILVAFGASGFVLYNGFFKSNDNAAIQASPSAGGSASGTPGSILGGTTATSPSSYSSIDSQGLLPYGGKLDYSILDKDNLQSVDLVKPTLNFSSSVGIPEQNLITPPVSSGQ